MSETAPRGSLHLRTVELMRNRPRVMTYEAMVAELASRNCRPISVDWLHNFQCGKLVNIDVDKVQAVFELLSGTMLTIN